MFFPVQFLHLQMCPGLLYLISCVCCRGECVCVVQIYFCKWQNNLDCLKTWWNNDKIIFNVIWKKSLFLKSHLFHTEPQNKSYLVWFQVTAAQERDIFFSWFWWRLVWFGSLLYAEISSNHITSSSGEKPGFFSYVSLQQE